MSDQRPDPVFRAQVPAPGMPPAPNQIAGGDGFYVSFNDVDHAIYGCDTTALVVGQMQAFYILDGDHRQDYAPLIEEGLDACLGYFRSHIDQMNERSDLPPSEGSVPGAGGPGI